MTRSRTPSTRGTLIALAGGIAVLFPEAIGLPARTADAFPDAIRLAGIVRDFDATHSDFESSPSAGAGHYAGNVGMTIGVDDRPMFTGAGFKVQSEWMDTNLLSIAPHLWGDGGTPRLLVMDEVVLDTQCRIDSFDSSLGPYGGANVGSAATVRIDSVAAGAVVIGADCGINGDVLVGRGGTPSTVISGISRVSGATGSLPQPMAMPAIELPTDVPGSSGPQDFNGGTVSITSNQHWGDTRMDGTRFEFDGDVTILIDGFLNLQDSGVDFIFAPGATLKLYCTDWMEIDDGAQLNMNTGDPSRLTIYMTATYDGSGDEEEAGLIDVEDGSFVTADIVAPNGKLLADNGCHLHGTFVGRSIELTNDSEFHVDLAVHATGCATADGPAGALGVAGHAGIASASSFSDWFTDVLGTNLSTRRDITLIDDGSGNYTYYDDDFHPIDGDLLGNDGAVHNHHLTYEIDAVFTYEACTGQFFQFAGGDGTWVFIDGQLVLDLEGADALMKQHVHLDRLGLADGEQHRLQFFHAQRLETSSRFRMKTNIELATPRLVPVVTAVFD